MRWPWSPKPKPALPRADFSISDPLLADFFRVGPVNLANVPVNEQTALGLSAVWRAVSLIAGTLAGLPMRTMRQRADGTRERLPSVLDEPGGLDGPTAFEWKETVLAHLLLHGNAYLAHVRNGAGGLAALVPIHPLAVTPEWEGLTRGAATGRKIFRVVLDDGRVKEFTQATMTHIPALSFDGLKGLSPIAVARQSLGTAIAGDRAAARMFGSGALIAGLVTPDEDLEENEVDQIKMDIDRKMAGPNNAGEIAVINRKLKFQQWSMSNEDAQFLQSRQFSIEEIARWYGVPPHALMQTEKQTSWGTGVAEQNRGLSRTVLVGWATRIDQRVARLVPRGVIVEHDFSALERGSPETETDLLIKKVQAKLMTVDEARQVLGLGPKPVDDDAGPTPDEDLEVPDEEEVAA